MFVGRKGDWFLVECDSCNEQRLLRKKPYKSTCYCLKCGYKNNANTQSREAKTEYVEVTCPHCSVARNIAWATWEQAKSMNKDFSCRGCAAGRPRDSDEARAAKKKAYATKYRRSKGILERGDSVIAEKAKAIKAKEATMRKIDVNEGMFQPQKIVDDNYQQFIEEYLAKGGSVTVEPTTDLPRDSSGMQMRRH